jgi:hypothetical protein
VWPAAAFGEALESLGGSETALVSSFSTTTPSNNPAEFSQFQMVFSPRVSTPVLFLLCGAVHHATSFQVYNVRTYGAVGDGVQYDTFAVRRAAG